MSEQFIPALASNLPLQIKVKVSVFTQSFALHNPSHQILINTAKMIQHRPIIIDHSRRDHAPEYHFPQL